MAIGMKRTGSGAHPVVHPGRHYRPIVTAALVAMPLMLLVASAQASQPIVIRTVTELQDIDKNLAGDYALGGDIDASATKSWNGGAGFIPLGEYPSKPFTGTLNGAGHTVSNLAIKTGDTTVYTGLFAYLGAAATVKNLKLSAVHITSSYNGFLNGKDVTGYIGALAAVNYGTISALTANGSVSLEGYENVVAGLVAYNQGAIESANSAISVTATQIDSTTNLFIAAGLVGVNYVRGKAIGTISNSRDSGKIVGNLSETGNGGNGYVGGLTGLNYGLVSHSSSSNAVFCAGCAVGGLVGFNVKGAHVTDSSSTATVSGGINGDIGGLVGDNAEGATITGGKAAGDVSANGSNTYIGGLIGFNSGTVTESLAKGAVIGRAGSESSADIAQLGGLVGYNDLTGVVEKSFATGNVTDDIDGPPGGIDIGGLVGVNTGGPSGGIVAECYATGDVSGTGEGTNAGGLVGSNSYTHANGRVENSYATGSVRGGPDSPVGAVVGNNDDGDVEDVFGAGKVTGGKGAFLGGVIGANRDNNIVRDAYWDLGTTGRTKGAGTGSQAGMAGESDSVLKSGRLPTGFSAAVWAAKRGFYPYLRWQPAP